MTRQIDHKTIDAAMRQGRLERAYALRSLARNAISGIRNAARTLVAVFV